MLVHQHLYRLIYHCSNNINVFFFPVKNHASISQKTENVRSTTSVFICTLTLMAARQSVYEELAEDDVMLMGNSTLKKVSHFGTSFKVDRRAYKT